jgi:hypothetical protein
MAGSNWNTATTYSLVILSSLLLAKNYKPQQEYENTRIHSVFRLGVASAPKFP